MRGLAAPRAMEQLPPRVEDPVQEVDESFLGALGVHRLPVPVPFIEAGGPVNVYAIENDDSSWTLFDTGVATDEGLAAVRAGAAQQGVDLRRVSRIVVSHGHIDHYGNAQTLAEESGARVFAHRGDLDKLCGDERWFAQLTRHAPYFQGLGVPPPVLQAMLEGSMRSKRLSRQVEPARLGFLEGGEALRFKHFDAEVMHLPGHTPGLVCLHAPAQRLLFADDHLLARVSPNPLLDLSMGEGEGKFKALVAYLESARKARALELDCVLPGHGPPFRGHRALLDGLFEFYGRRQDKLLAHLAKGPATVYELAGAIFPRRDVPRMYLMLSEVLGNLEVLEAAGRLRKDLVDGAVRYSRLPASG